MGIVGGLDIHRRQITFDCVDTETGQERRGRIGGADRLRVREWLQREFGGRTDVDLALGGCTGWRYVAEELADAGVGVHLADPAEVSARRGPKKRAKTDRSDARLQRDLLMRGELPECWVPPCYVLDQRAAVRTYKALRDTRAAWQQRLQAVVFHHGLAEAARVTAAETRQVVADPDAALSPMGRLQVEVGYRMIDAVNAEMVLLRHRIAAFARRQRACRALMDQHYGVGPLTAVALWSEIGDARRFRRADQVVRLCGLDVTVHSSDTTRSRGRLSHEGSAVLRWALYEAGTCASRGGPDHHYYRRVKARLDGTRAALSVGRKIARRAFHTLRGLGDEVLQPPLD